MLLPLSSSADRWASGKISGRATIVGYGNTISSPSQGFVGSGPKRWVEQTVYEVREGRIKRVWYYPAE